MARNSKVLALHLVKQTNTGPHTQSDTQTRLRFEGAHIDQTSGEPTASHANTTLIDTPTDSLCFTVFYKNKNDMG